MTRCTVPTGFFLLGPCGRARVASCARCGRAVCGEHRERDGLCPECLTAREHEAGASPGPFDKGWSRRFRRDYYERIQDVYDDGGWYSRLDSYDRGAFDHDAERSHGDDDPATDTDTGFVDS